MSWLLAVMVCAAPGDLATAVKAQLVDAEVVRGGFEQRKQVKGFKRPLVSTGDFVVVRGRGVKWHTLAPFESVLTVSKDDIVAKQGATEVFRLDGAKEPTVRVINSVLFALLAGDVAVLRTHFEVDGALDPKGWHLRLTPKAVGLAQVLAQVTIEGDAFVRRLELTEAAGDTTLIRIEGPKAGPPLSVTEQSEW
jgi:outer membrane lipoprotein-sorting protein